jgi:hypothetical protein
MIFSPDSPASRGHRAVLVDAHVSCDFSKMLRALGYWGRADIPGSRMSAAAAATPSHPAPTLILAASNVPPVFFLSSPQTP